jgi:hypothetical protein
MTTPEFIAPPIKSSLPIRILIFTLGLLLLAFGALITLGTELLAILGILVAWVIRKRQGRQLGRGGAWMASVAGAMIPVFVLLLGAMIASPIKPPTAAERKESFERQQRLRDSMPEFLRKMTANQRQSGPAVDSMADRLLQNKKVLIWFEGMAAVMGSAMVGAFAGTLGWGAAMLLYRATKDEWLGTAPLVLPSEAEPAA